MLPADILVTGFQVAPPSVDITTPATAPPPAPLAVPLMVTAEPWSMASPVAGDVIVEVGGFVSWLAALRTTNGMRLPFPVVVSSRFRWARYKPGTALGGTGHEADTAQLPHSVSPAGALSFLHAGWDCGSVAVGTRPSATKRAPSPWYVAHAQDVDVVRLGRGVDLEILGLPGVHAH